MICSIKDEIFHNVKNSMNLCLFSCVEDLGRPRSLRAPFLIFTSTRTGPLRDLTFSIVSFNSAFVETEKASIYPEALAPLTQSKSNPAKNIYLNDYLMVVHPQNHEIRCWIRYVLNWLALLIQSSLMNQDASRQHRLHPSSKPIYFSWPWKLQELSRRRAPLSQHSRNPIHQIHFFDDESRTTHEREIQL